MIDKAYLDTLELFDARKESFMISFKTMKSACKTLTDEELGAVMRQLFIYAYSRQEIHEFPNTYDRSDFMLFVYDRFRDDENAYYGSYEERCRKNSENQKQRWAKQKALNQAEEQDTNVYERIQTNTNYTDNDIDNDTDNDNGNGNGNENDKIAIVSNQENYTWEMPELDNFEVDLNTGEVITEPNTPRMSVEQVTQDAFTQEVYQYAQELEQLGTRDAVKMVPRFLERTPRARHDRNWKAKFEDFCKPIL